MTRELQSKEGVILPESLTPASAVEAVYQGYLVFVTEQVGNQDNCSGLRNFLLKAPYKFFSSLTPSPKLPNLKAGASAREMTNIAAGKMLEEVRKRMRKLRNDYSLNIQEESPEKDWLKIAQEWVAEAEDREKQSLENKLFLVSIALQNLKNLADPEKTIELPVREGPEGKLLFDFSIETDNPLARLTPHQATKAVYESFNDRYGNLASPLQTVGVSHELITAANLNSEEIPEEIRRPETTDIESAVRQTANYMITKIRDNLRRHFNLPPDFPNPEEHWLSIVKLQVAEAQQPGTFPSASANIDKIALAWNNLARLANEDFPLLPFNQPRSTAQRQPYFNFLAPLPADNK
jgi:hypothetical protein